MRASGQETTAPADGKPSLPAVAASSAPASARQRIRPAGGGDGWNGFGPPQAEIIGRYRGGAAPPDPLSPVVMDATADAPKDAPIDAIVVDHLTKRYGTPLAVDDIGFAVPAGGTVGLLGGNGAGKTT